MKVLNDDLMTTMEYHRYILSECERQWKECQEEKYGPWDSQSDDEKADYYNSLYSEYENFLGKACCDCSAMLVKKMENFIVILAMAKTMEGNSRQKLL
ncbi:MAG: hypothetical protein ACLTX3_08715 [Lachnospiraceae bacterium]